MTGGWSLTEENGTKADAECVLNLNPKYSTNISNLLQSLFAHKCPLGV